MFVDDETNKLKMIYSSRNKKKKMSHSHITIEINETYLALRKWNDQLNHSCLKYLVNVNN